MRFKEILRVIRQIQRSNLKLISGTEKIKPKVIQLPITYNCDSKCVMCNIWQMDSSNESSVEEFSRYMRDDIFSEVTSVGINGGEVSLIPNLPSYVEEVTKLSKLKSITLISNGFKRKSLLGHLEQIKKICSEKNIALNLIISLDGVKDVHERVRGVNNAFDKVIKTYRTILDEQGKYCDRLELACTVVDQNINELVELDVFCRENKFKIKYRLGIENKRIESYKLVENFSVIYDKNRQTAKEFFHWMYKRTPMSNFQEKYKYFCIFDWLENEKRRIGCDWKNQGITLDSRGELYYCAVKSEPIGSIRTQVKSGSDIFFSEENLNYRSQIIKDECDSCIHDYVGTPYYKDVAYFLMYEIKQRSSMKMYKFRTLVGL